jgi:hypothetical protein
MVPEANSYQVSNPGHRCASYRTVGQMLIVIITIQQREASEYTRIFSVSCEARLDKHIVNIERAVPWLNLHCLQLLNHSGTLVRFSSTVVPYMSP